MANKIKASVEGLAVVGAFAAIVAQDVLVRISGDDAFAEAGSGHIVAGRVSVAAKAAGGKGTVETPFKERHTIRTAANVTAGQIVKLAAAAGGLQRVTPWVDGTDSVTLQYGIAIVGANSGADADILTF